MAEKEGRRSVPLGDPPSLADAIFAAREYDRR